MSAARPETGATVITEHYYPIPPYAVELFAVGFGLWRGRIRRLSSDAVLASIPAPGVRGVDAAKRWAKETVAGFENHAKERDDHLIPPGYRLIPDALWDALTALLDAGDSRGISDGRAAAEHVWQNAENARDAAREEMGL